MYFKLESGTSNSVFVEYAPKQFSVEAGAAEAVFSLSVRQLTFRLLLLNVSAMMCHHVPSHTCLPSQAYIVMVAPQQLGSHITILICLHNP